MMKWEEYKELSKIEKEEYNYRFKGNTGRLIYVLLGFGQGMLIATIQLIMAVVFFVAEKDGFKMRQDIITLEVAMTTVLAGSLLKSLCIFIIIEIRHHINKRKFLKRVKERKSNNNIKKINKVKG